MSVGGIRNFPGLGEYYVRMIKEGLSKEVAFQRHLGGERSLTEKSIGEVFPAAGTARAKREAGMTLVS